MMIAQVLAIILIFIFCGFLFFISKEIFVNNNRLKEGALKEFNEVLSKIGNQNSLKILINANAYEWMESSINKARDEIINSCQYGRGRLLITDIARYQIKYEKETNRLYLALNTPKSNPWPDLKLNLSK